MFDNMYTLRIFKHVVKKKKASVPLSMTNGQD